MKKSLAALACFMLLDIAGPMWPRLVEAAPAKPAPVAQESVQEAPAEDPAVTRSVRDYLAVRKVALALAVIGFMLGLIRLGMSEFPAERHRAQTLMALTSVVFVLVAGDRTIARGVADWFHLSTDSLPPFWR